MTTFALVPRRERVIAAKLLACLALTLAAVGVCLLMSVAATALVPVVGQGTGTWDVAASGLATTTLFAAMRMLAGAALGLLLMNSPAAIVLTFLIPTGIVGLGGISGFERFVRWIDLGTVAGELNRMHPAISAREWAYLSAGVALWVLVPLALGFLRLRHREVVTS